jgi:hypothetical protein
MMRTVNDMKNEEDRTIIILFIIKYRDIVLTLRNHHASSGMDGLDSFMIYLDIVHIYI